MQKSFLVLHGWMGSPPPHWQSWLVEELRARGHHVAFPELPDPDRPERAAWSVAIRNALTRGPNVVVCHSLGSLAWLDCVASFTAPLAPRVLLVAPPGRSEAAALGLRGFADCVLDREAVARAAGEVRLVCSNADTYCAEGAAIAYAKPLAIPCDVLEPAAGHINVAAGFGPWPQALAWCLEQRKAIDGRL